MLWLYSLLLCIPAQSMEYRNCSFGVLGQSITWSQLFLQTFNHLRESRKSLWERQSSGESDFGTCDDVTKVPRCCHSILIWHMGSCSPFERAVNEPIIFDASGEGLKTRQRLVGSMAFVDRRIHANICSTSKLMLSQRDVKLLRIRIIKIKSGRMNYFIFYFYVLDKILGKACPKILKRWPVVTDVYDIAYAGARKKFARIDPPEKWNLLRRLFVQSEFFGSTCPAQSSSPFQTVAGQRPFTIVIEISLVQIPGKEGTSAISGRLV